ncbi:RagB/SusD family nutrient uptake outer membrane protein [Halosquirtibacter laminarini]|uniref:RagB/SusD family nutrient uptake outer membrane protein n=1 Tax=Halosquirtibacter laminarini TaxID=3374600 RepID=A0AC61NMJ4_9BACT|nr:RagB/SusD family nutrient uptake outer membrane protein [Prolixibacteraceae bacterium]
MKINIRYIFLIISVLFISSCEKVLDKEYLEAINPTDIWNQESLSEAYVNNFYAKVMPGWSIGTGTSSDEACHIGQISSLLNGTATIDSHNNWQYNNIRTVNIFFANIDTGSLTEEEKNPLKGQMYFWRAWMYASMVNSYGGVPLITEVQDVSSPDVFMKRNSTTECMTQIFKDLDNAIKFLPNNWSGKDVGRIDKVAALAFKGRIALRWASPLFNPTREIGRWQEAYNVNKEAQRVALENGKGLCDKFKDIWYNELNKEVIMVRRFHNPGSTYFVGGIRPLIYSKDMALQDTPSLELANAFPMKDGSDFDPSAGYASLSANRDDRFYATIAYNGSDMHLADMIEQGTFLWTYYRYSATEEVGSSTEGSHISASSFYRQKGQDLQVKQSQVYDATLDNVVIRYAEVLMNLGEAANEIGRPNEALDILHQIRGRASIEPGPDGNYGITATSKEEIREAYFKENFVEFAFEGKRWNELRRLRKFDHLNSIGKRHGLRWILKDDGYEPTGYDDISTPEIYERFKIEVRETDEEKIEIPDTYYFYAIPRKHLERNSKLEQTKGWEGGTFDPLL